jgi:hypothetical protein
MKTSLLAAFLLTLLTVGVQAAEPWAPKLAQQALDSGFLTRLPPDVSRALGLAKPEEGTDVRQLLTKVGHQVRTFNVGVVDHKQLVIFNLNARSGESVAYLLAPDGSLRKAVTYQTGGETQPLAPDKAGAGLTREAHFWAARAKAAAAAPAPQNAPAH